MSHDGTLPIASDGARPTPGAPRIGVVGGLIGRNSSRLHPRFFIYMEAARIPGRALAVAPSPAFRAQAK